ncbi:MAG: PEP-CTERM sorting domain-containing protein [Planctomycetota bacterium]
MDLPNSFVRTPLTALVLLGMTQGAQAGVIDTTPPDSLSPYYALYAAAGGTFVADDTNLESFTLALNSAFSGNVVYTAIVMDTTPAGLPDSVLWEEQQTFPGGGGIVTRQSTPNLAITPGETYFIGFEIGNGNLTTTGGSGEIELQLRSGNPIEGNWYQYDGDTWSNLGSNLDIASRIVMTPEPNSLALLGLGGLVVAWRRR